MLPKLGRKLKKEDVENIGTVIEETIKSAEFSEGRNEIRETAWMYKGQAVANAVDYMENKLKELDTKEQDQ